MVAMIINGKMVAGDSSRDVINPATETGFATVPDCSRAQLDDAMTAAETAFQTWKGDIAARRRVLKACAEALRRRADTLAPILTMEQGKPQAKAKREIMGAAKWLDYTACLDIPVEILQDDADMRVELHRRPMGVIGAIVPWNYPIMIAVAKMAPALLAGNTIVLKPSPFTPLATLWLAELFNDIIPPGVMNVVSGGNDCGAWIAQHPAVRKVTFTGSTATGKKVAGAAAQDLKRLTLELGGNDAAIVLDDADPEGVAEKLFWGAFENSGQVCAAIKRLFIHERLYEPLIEELAARARRTRLGDGRDPGVELGPLNNRPQFERVCDLVEDARAKGGRIITGGARVGDRGFFFAPTLVTDLADDARLVVEEQFGPVLPILSFKDEDEVVGRANGTRFGLGGSVWSGRPERAAELAGRLDCGTAWVNQHLTVLPHAPSGGHKWSGIGVENGPWGLQSFLAFQTVEIPK